MQENDVGTVLPDLDSIHRPVTQLESHAAKKALEVWISMDGNTVQYYPVLKDKIVSWVTHSSTKSFTPPNALARFPLQPLLLCHFPFLHDPPPPPNSKPSKNNSASFSSPKLRLPPSFSLIAHHSPSTCMGLNLPHLELELEQGITQLTAFIEQGFLPSISGNIILISMEVAQLKVGTSAPFYIFPDHLYSHLLTDI